MVDAYYCKKEKKYKYIPSGLNLFINSDLIFIPFPGFDKYLTKLTKF